MNALRDLIFPGGIQSQSQSSPRSHSNKKRRRDNEDDNDLSSSSNTSGGDEGSFHDRNDDNGDDDNLGGGDDGSYSRTKLRSKHDSLFLGIAPLISDKKGSISLMKKHAFPQVYYNSPEIVYNHKGKSDSRNKGIESIESIKYAPGLSNTFLFHQSRNNNTKLHGNVLKSLFFECFYGGDFEGALEIFKSLNNLVPIDTNYVAFFAQILNETTERKSLTQALARAVLPKPKQDNKSSIILMPLLTFFAELFVCNNDIYTAISFLQTRLNSFGHADNTILHHFMAVLVIIKAMNVLPRVFNKFGRNENDDCPKIIDMITNPLGFRKCVRLLKIAANFVRGNKSSDRLSRGSNYRDSKNDPGPLSDLSSEDELDNSDRYNTSYAENTHHLGGYVDDDNNDDDDDAETLGEQCKLLLIELDNTLKMAISKNQDDLHLKSFYLAYLNGNNKGKEGKKVAKKFFKRKLKSFNDENNKDEVAAVFELRESFSLYMNYITSLYENQHEKLVSLYENKLKEHIIHFAISDSTDLDSMYIALLLYKKGDLDKIAYIQTICTHIEQTNGGILINVFNNIKVTSKFKIDSENMSSIMLRWSLWRILASLIGCPISKYHNTDDRIKSSSELAVFFKSSTNKRRHLLSNQDHDCNSIFDILYCIDDSDDSGDNDALDDYLQHMQWWLSTILSPLQLGDCVSYITDLDVEKVIVKNKLKLNDLRNRYVARHIDTESDYTLNEIFNAFRKKHRQLELYLQFTGVNELQKYTYEDSSGEKIINSKVALGIKQTLSPLNSKTSMHNIVGSELIKNMNKQNHFTINHNTNENFSNSSLYTFRYLGDIHLEILAYQVIFHTKLSKTQDTLFVVRCCQIICEHALQELKVNFTYTTTAHKCIKFLKKNKVNFKRACRIAFLISLFES